MNVENEGKVLKFRNSGWELGRDSYLSVQLRCGCLCLREVPQVERSLSPPSVKALQRERVREEPGMNGSLKPFSVDSFQFIDLIADKLQISCKGVRQEPALESCRLPLAENALQLVSARRCELQCSQLRVLKGLGLEGCFPSAEEYASKPADADRTKLQGKGLEQG